MTKIFKVFASLIITVVLFIFFLELFARYKNPSWHESDPSVGWKLKSNFSHKYKNYDQNGNIYYSNFKTNEDGLRVYGNTNSDLKILIIGDSFTADPYSGNSKMWYSVMSDEISQYTSKDVVAYAGGGGGYGTLQQYLLLREINKKYSYDIFILQFCSNDFGNNLFEEETTGNNFNQFFKRPYLTKKGNIIFYESFFANLFRSKLIGESKFFNKILFLYSKTIKEKKLNKFYRNKNYKDSLEITNLLLKKIRSIVNLDNAYMVNCDYNLSGRNKDWKLISKKNGFIPLELPSLDIEESIKNNKNIFYKDLGHYNDLGNLIFGRSTFKELIKYQNFNF
jgi:hypothetical protein